MAKKFTNPNILVRDEIAKLPVPGFGVKYDEFQRNNPELEIIRLGSNENLFGPSPKVLQTIQKHIGEVNFYPDNTCTEISEKMGTILDIDPARLVFDCGAESIMLTLMNVCLRPGDKVVSFVPSFPPVYAWTAATGAEVIGIEHDDDLSFSAEEFASASAGGVRMVYLCMPNNPTGSYFTGPELEAVVNACSSDTLFVIDEAYFEFSRDKEDYPDAIQILEAAGQPYISLRTMSKAYALAGMRIGYAICYHEELAGLIKRANTVFNVGVLTLKAAIAALDDISHVNKCLKVISTEKSRVEKEMLSMGVRLFNSAGNFNCVWLSEFSDALAIQNKMQDVGIFIKAQKGRPKESGNFEGVLRITVGTAEYNDKMLDRMKDLI